MTDNASRASAVLAAERKREARVREVARRVNTVFIGALAKFEAHFAGLWGGRSDRAPPKDGEEAAAAWAACRTEVLNNGNAQLRALLAYLDGEMK